MLQMQLNNANETNRMLQAQLEEESRTVTALQVHAEGSRAIDLAYSEIGDFISHHLFKYTNYLLKRKMRWEPFVET